MYFVKHTHVVRHFRLVALSLAALSLVFLAAGLTLVFCWVPDDYLQGELVKIIYVHMPCVWLSLFFYCLMSLASVVYVIKEVVFFDMIARAAFPVVISMTATAIATGAIWVRSACGAWWVWDVKLTSMLILLFIIIAYAVIRNTLSETRQAAKISSLFAIIGLINLPIIKFSVDIWSTLHQPSSIFKATDSAIHASMPYPIIVMFLCMLSFGGLITIIRLRTAIYYLKAQHK